MACLVCSVAWELYVNKGWYAVLESSKSRIEWCGSRRKIPTSYDCMPVVYIFTSPRLLFSGYRGSFLGGKAAGELSWTPPSNAESKNVWSCTSLSPVFMEWTVRTVAIPSICTRWHRKWIYCTEWRTKHSPTGSWVARGLTFYDNKIPSL